MNSIMSDLDLSDNIAALAIAVIRKDVKTVDDAFKILDRRMVSTREIMRLKSLGLKNTEIGEITGMTAKAVNTRINIYKKEFA